MKRLNDVSLLLLAAALAMGCSEPAQDQVQEQTSEAAQAGGEAVDGTARDIQGAADHFTSNARQALDELGRSVDDLHVQYSDAVGDAAAEWDSAQREILAAQQQLEMDIARAGEATGESLDSAREDIADGVEMLATRVEQARLAAVDGTDEFVAESQRRLSEIEGNIEELRLQASQLTADARADVSDDIESLRMEAADVAQRLDAMAAASAGQMAEAREDVTQAIAGLSGSVQRHGLELAGDATGQ